VINRDVATSALANAWAGLVQLAFIPVYMELLGLEAYGLIGFYGVLQVSLGLLDLGLTATVNRETGLFRAGVRDSGEARRLLRSVEVVLAAIGVGFLFAWWWLAPWVAGGWLGLERLDDATAGAALRLMAALVAIRLVFGAYRAALAGAQAFGWLNGANAGFATLRGAGVVPVLWLAPSIEAFFTCQLAITVLEGWLTRRRAWALFPQGEPASFSGAALRSVRRFSGGVLGASAASLAVTQADKLVVSAALPLAQFGYYALASAVASCLALLAAPVAMVAYPRLTEAVGRSDEAAAGAAFREALGLVVLAVAPAAVVLAAFARAILEIWTGDPLTSAQAAPLLAVLAIGSMLNAGLQVPYLLALAQGRSGAAAAFTGILAALYIPALLWAVARHGAPGAAWGWLGLNACAALSLVVIGRRARPASQP